MAKKDFQVTCPDHPDWTVGDLTAKQAKDTADEHDETEHNGQSVALTERRPTEDSSERKSSREGEEAA
jgi:hypothetical protein